MMFVGASPEWRSRCAEPVDPVARQRIRPSPVIRSAGVIMSAGGGAVVAKKLLLVLAAVLLGVVGVVTPAAAQAPQLAPAGCTTSIQWVTQGSNYFYGLGSVQCTSGRYRAKEICINNQTGAGYVIYGTQVVNAPATATVLCNTGNSAQTVYAVTDPPDSGQTGCVSWSEWVTQGSNYFYGRGQAQCDTGRYKVKVVCLNEQTGVHYVLTGTQAVTAPAAVSLTCNTGNTAQTVQAVADPPTGGTSGCVAWTEWVTQGSNYFFGRGEAQCDTGQYRVKALCHNNQSGDYYILYGPAVSAPTIVSVTCNTGNTAQTVQAVAEPAGTGLAGCMIWSAWVVQGSSMYFGRGSAQCDSGQFYAQLACHNVQTGQNYVLNGPVVTGPTTSTTTCLSGNTVTAVTTIAA
jgi:uncharacterized protein (UPF0179 family)